MAPTEFLTPERQTVTGHMHNPYTDSGARSILRRFRDDVIDMLEFMFREQDNWEAGKAFLSQSPLARKVWVAAAMKTLGLLEERPSPNGSCAVILTEKAIQQYSSLRKYL